MGFVHLHLHTEYSLLDGACRTDRLFSHLAEMGQTAAAITDHGVMYGAVAFYQEAKKAGIKPIIGCEVYLAPRSRFDKDYAKDGERYHLTLLVKNREGYRNLARMVSLSYTEGFYMKPRIDMALIENLHEGLIALSGCASGLIPRLIMSDSFEKAKAEAEKLDKLFGRGNFYLEIQDHGYPDDKKINDGIKRIAAETGVPLCATNDAHYIRREDAKMQSVLTCIQTNNRLEDGNPLGFKTEEFYLKSEEEMRALFPEVPEAVDNTVKIAEKCNFEFDFETRKLPRFPLPEGINAGEYLRSLAEKGLAKMEKEGLSADFEVYKKRLDYELEVIGKMGFDDYMLIVADFVNYAKDRGIYVGPGRGSGAGCLVARCLNITGVDPIKYGLIFERFLNPERVSMPDIDVDFCIERRGEVIDYLSDKYGKDHVSQIVTFGTMAARAAVRDVGRVLGYTYAETDLVAKKIPRGATLEGALIDPEFRKIYETDERARQLVDISKSIEGMPRHASMHAAGVVITDKPLYEYVPLATSGDSVISQYDMNQLAELGLLKIDLLGIRYLTVMKKTVTAIKKRVPDFSLEKIPENDKKTYDMIADGNTVGVFQLESPGMIKLLRAMKPQSIEDITAAISLYRPGPMDSIDSYLENRENGTFSCAVEAVRPILENTCGCILYQEQVMEIFRKVAGYSYGRADIVRRAMSKKKQDVMAREKEAFLKGAVNNGVPEKDAVALYERMAEFAKYAFNKSHAVSYAHLCYSTAYLKANYPGEYMASLLTMPIEEGKLPQYMSECLRMGINIMPPDILDSEGEFEAKPGGIRFGLYGIKNVGEKAIDSIIAERRVRPYSSFEDFLIRNKRVTNKRMAESLIKCGVFDRFRKKRSVLLAVYEKAIDDLSASSRQSIEGQMSLFSGDAGESPLEINYPETEELSKAEMLSYERQITGLYLSGHPLYEYEDYALSINAVPLCELENAEASEKLDGESVTVFGQIKAVNKKITKNGSKMAFLKLEDMGGEAELILFPKVYEKYADLVIQDLIVAAEGKLSVKEESFSVIVDEMKKVTPRDGKNPLKTVKKVPAKEKNHRIYLRLPSKEGTILNKVMSAIGDSNEGMDTFLYFADSGTTVRVKGKKTPNNEKTVALLRLILGEENVVLKTYD